MTAQLLQNKVALVTGANRGIGAAVAKVFAGHGAPLSSTTTAAASLPSNSSPLSPRRGDERLPVRPM
jgi:NAD(P)-dependent dehydrogenase (short-subunit alcohol dehydrogenase family)